MDDFRQQSAWVDDTMNLSPLHNGKGKDKDKGEDDQKTQ